MLQRHFQKLPLERKLRALMTLAAVTALLAAGVAFGVGDFLSFRRAIVAEVGSLAEIVGGNSIGALEFGDRAVAQETLFSLRLRPSIVAAGLYGASGELLARYLRPGEQLALPLQLVSAGDEHHFEAGHLHLRREIRYHGTNLGTLYLRSDMQQLYARLGWFLVTAGVGLLLSTLIAFVVSARLQGYVSRPIMSLVKTVRRVSRYKDYSARASHEGDDELGVLVTGFNEMIEEIERHDLERERARRVLADQAAELVRSNAELDDFAYIASHDLKEPLRGIHNYSLILLEDYGEDLEGDGKEKLETLSRLSQRMAALIDTLLHFSRVGRTEHAVGSTDLDRIVREVVETLAPRLSEEGVEVRIPRPLPTVVCDAARVGEVFRNLITNAMKYSDKEQRWMEIGWRDGGAPGPAARLITGAVNGEVAEPVFTVRDNGIGVEERYLETIFRIFRRLHGRDRYGGGTGAGLSIVRKIVERHGGRLWVESTVGEGTTFSFTLGAKNRGPEQEHPDR